MNEKSDIKGLLKTYMQVEKEAQEIKEKQIRLAKRIPDVKPRPQQKITPIQTQVTVLKQKRKELEKESQKIQQYDYQQKIIQTELKNQLKQTTASQNDILLNLEKVAQETQFTYLKFRIEKFMSKLIKVFNVTKQKKYFITILKGFNIQEQNTINIEFRQFWLLKKTFQALKEELIQARQERIQREEQQKQKYEIGQHQLAIEFRNFCLMNKCFKSIKKFTKMNKLTKQFENDQNEIKVKVDNFLVQMQQQIVNDLEKEKKDIQLLKQSQLHDADLTISDSENSEKEYESQNIQDYQSKEEILELLIQPIQKPNLLIPNQQNIQEIQDQKSESYQSDNDEIPIKQEKSIDQIPQQHPFNNPWNQKPQLNIQNIVEDNEQSIQKQDTSKAKSKSVNKQNIIQTQIEEKAKKRKEMHDQIRQKQEEKKKQKELLKQEQEKEKQLEIKRQKEEEYNRIQEKKKKEQELQEKKQQEQFELQYKMDVAKKHYQKQLQKFQIFIPLLKEHQQQIKNEMKANIHYQNILKKMLINNLLKAKEIQDEQKQYEEQINLNLAEQHYNRRLKQLVIIILKENYNQLKIKLDDANKIRKEFLIRHIMTNWYIQLPELRVENLKLAKVTDNLVTDFRKAILQKQFFTEWLQVVRDNKASKLREQTKQVMWQKVNQWLSEFNENQQ